MKQPIKFLLILLGVGCIVALAFVGWSAKAKNDATFHLANGMQVTPIEVKSDDTARILDIKTWKFDVVQPDAVKPFGFNLCLCHAGKFVENVGYSSELVPDALSKPSLRNQPLHITVSLEPMGDTFFNAHQLKYFLDMNGMGQSGTMPNPFLHSHGSTENIQVITAQNVALLMSGNLKKPNTQSPPSQNEMAVALNFNPTIGLKSQH